jgi:2-polyprenyl-3-methyl-5-hydroxy-6-metoxy-1,4-benzoquinol methylase
MSDQFDPSRRFVLGGTKSSRLEVDFFNLYAWLLQFVHGKAVLDIACGSGLGSFLLAHWAASVDGVDISAESVAYATDRYRLPNLHFRVADVLDVQLPVSQYDVVICSMTLEQLDPAHHDDFLRKLSASLKPQGLLIVVTPNKRVTSPYAQIGGAHQWNKHEYIASELRAALETAGFGDLRWFGRRRVFALFALIPVRKAVGALQKIIKGQQGDLIS